MNEEAFASLIFGTMRVGVGKVLEIRPHFGGLAVRRTARKGSTMLVLSRKKNESIVINNDITIVVVEIRGDKVRLGVEAPKEVPVHRREVYDAIVRNGGHGAAASESSQSTPKSGDAI